MTKKTGKGINKDPSWIATFGMTTPMEKLFHDTERGVFFSGLADERIAMVGRSNVGKSSLINALLKRKLAQVSGQPGKTRLIHFYHWPEGKVILVDLPGYGYAKTSQSEREVWKALIDRYLKFDLGLNKVFLLFDSRHDFSKQDLESIDYFMSKDFEVFFVMTKIDQIKNQSERARRKKEVSQRMTEWGLNPDLVFWVSSETKDGILKLTQTLTTLADKDSSK